MLKKDDTIGHDRDNPKRPQLYTKYSRQLKKAGSRSGLPQARVQQFVVQRFVVSCENTCTNNIIWTEQVIFRVICVDTYKQACSNN